MPTISINLSEANEGMDSPWWVIIDPCQMMKPDFHTVAQMVTGPFFSRDEAEGHLNGRRYAFSSRAVVYCMTGYWSHQYKMACRAAETTTGTGQP